MKKALCKIIELFKITLAIIMALILGFFVILYIPIDYFIYKNSLYYQKTHKKYRLYYATSQNFKIANKILSHNLPIHFIESGNPNGNLSGWFVYENTLIIPNHYPFKFHHETGTWLFTIANRQEEQIILSLDEYIESELEQVNNFAGHTVCNDAVVLINCKDLDTMDLAIQEKRFLVYQKDRVEALMQLCQSN